MKSISVMLLVFMIIGPVFSCASGLNNIPTADVLSKGSMFFASERWTSLGSSSEPESYTYFQLGIGHGLELGYDVYPDHLGVFNIKTAIPAGSEKFSLALGLQNIGDGLKPQPYLVGYKESTAGRFHTGILGSEGNLRAILGFDRPLNSRITLQTDYISGSENCATVGLWIDLGNRMGINAAYLYNNSGEERGSLSLIFALSIQVDRL